ncbi:hypothetical protein [Litorimonas cladophorae]|nr:hypothetical protein [Litorimonas cladophorae]
MFYNLSIGDERESDHPDEGGNWPSTTGNPSGGGRGNAKDD